MTDGSAQRHDPSAELPGDHARVCELLGREPRGRYAVVVRNPAGDPVVLRNAPLLDDGTPMPTRFWLVDPEEIRRIGRIESRGGVDRAEAEVDAAELEAAHARYADERDADIPIDHDGPRPTGGVGGTRIGVKCLHAHWAWHLAGGDDPVGRWIERQLAHGGVLRLTLSGAALAAHWDGRRTELPLGVERLNARWLSEHDPPRAESFTNAIGEVADHLDDLVRAHPEIMEVRTARIDGPTAWSIARLETGLDEPSSPIELARDTVEEVFRLAATETRADRAQNPGLPSRDVETVLAALCIVVATMRRLALDRVVIARPGSDG